MKRRSAASILAVAAVVAAAAVAGWRCAGVAEAAEAPRIEFWGAARSVGGSCLVVTAGGARFAIDCGALGEQGGGALPPAPDSLDFLVLTHAHVDHCGLVPELYAAGFDGPVYCTPPTARLAPIMLGMMRGLSGKRIARETLEASIAGLVPVPFHERRSAGVISFRFTRAEHLLGAASVELWLPAGDDTVKLVVSGDVGGGNSVLLRGPEIPESADYVVMESTYGARTREAGDDPPGTHERFAAALAAAVASGGDVLVPAFTLGRTQEVMAVVDEAQRAGTIPREAEIWVDSPTAKRISDVYRACGEELSDRARRLYPGEILRFPSLREVRSATSLRVHERRHPPAVFVTSSGDLEHANAPRHLMRMFAERRDLLCVIGWQPPGSLGARLLAGETPVLVRHQEGRETREDWIAPSLAVKQFHSFSGHANADGLLAWASGVRGARRIFLVHGEEAQARALAEALRSRLGVDVDVPGRGEARELAPARRRGR